MRDKFLNMFINYCRRSCVFLCCCLPAMSFALSLGDKEVLSYLNEPIRVEIELLQWQGIDLTRLEIKLASAAEFEAFGIEYLPFLNELQFSLPQEISGDTLKILLSGSSPMREPYLDILVSVRWPGGSLLREYVMIIDPRSLTPAVSP